MSDIARRYLLSIVPLALLAMSLAGCGYKPLYGGTRPGLGADWKTAIHIPPATSRTEQVVRNALLDELAQSGIRAKSPHDLAIRVTKRLVPFALRSDESPTRYDVTLRVDYVLRLSGEKKSRVAGNNRARASYNVVASDYANIISQNAAEKRAAALLARQITVRLAVFFEAAAAK